MTHRTVAEIETEERVHATAEALWLIIVDLLMHERAKQSMMRDPTVFSSVATILAFRLIIAASIAGTPADGISARDVAVMACGEIARWFQAMEPNLSRVTP